MLDLGRTRRLSTLRMLMQRRFGVPPRRPFRDCPLLPQAVAAVRPGRTVGLCQVTFGDSKSIHKRATVDRVQGLMHPLNHASADLKVL